MFRKLKNNIEDYFFSHFAMTKSQRSGFLFLIVLIIGAEAFIQFFPFQRDSGEIQTFTPSEEAIALQLNTQKQEFPTQTNFDAVELTHFNPNALDAAGFEEIGFSQKQAASLIKYRNSLGGNFSSVEEFQNAYVMSDWMFDRIKDHIDLKPVAGNLVAKKNYTEKRNANTFENKPKVNIKPFFINKLDHAQWVALGFSEKQANVILNYKKSLPGQRFTNKEQFQQCFVVNDYMYDRLSPYIRFEKGETSDQNLVKNEPESAKPMTFNPNQMNQKDWQSLGFDAETASNILKYRDFIGGFKTLEDLKKCRYISEDDFERLKSSFVFE